VSSLHRNISVDRFANAMRKELDANSHKRGWEECEVGYLRTRLHQEVAELMRAIDGSESPERVLSECADVANFAMMISERYAALRKDEEGV
jgi:NTP pyrophosphatase (non-canonical NTP hydrolase)